MKTREQIFLEICEVLQNLNCLHVDTKGLGCIVDIVVSACEETIKDSPEWAFENLKKLKSK